MDYCEYLKPLFLSGELEGKTVKQIFSFIGAKSGSAKDEAREALLKLESELFVFSDEGRYLLFENAGLIKGRLRCHENGYGFVTRDDGGDLFIPPRAMNGALQGDVVYAKPLRGRRGSNDEAEIVIIVSHEEELVGVYEAESSYGFVVPDDRGYLLDIFVPFNRSRGAVTGDKVLVRLTRFPRGRNPEGEVKEIIGKKDDLGAEERAVVLANKIPQEFPEEVLSFVRNKNYSLDHFGRTDFRGETIITIDGEDARDLDDAISLKTLDNGHFLLGVHIADVSYFVPEGSVLDEEALRRGTSVYFPDTVIPMLPKELSNGLCSLNEGEDRFTLSCVMEVDENGDVKDVNLCEGVINSRRRMTYTAVDCIFEGDEKLKNTYSDVLPLLEKMKALAEILIRKRERRGSVELEVKEADIRVNARGEISITPVKRTLSHRIIEEFMILANESVAEFVRFTEAPFLYRVHEEPSAEKVADLYEYLSGLGIRARRGANGVHPNDFAAILKRAENKPVYPLVNKVMLRSMSKAKYSPENVGHFGLASDCYCHFTSPIRRYPDLVVHRALKYILGGRIAEWCDGHAGNIYETADKTSACERRADDAERAIDEVFKARYMYDRLGEEFKGIVSGVTAFGVFVELKNTVEGLIKIETLPRGSYEYDKKNFTLSSKRLSFRLGEPVTVAAAGVDISAGKIEFILVSKP